MKSIGTLVSSSFQMGEEINENDNHFPNQNIGSHLKIKNEQSSEELFVAAFLKDSGMKFESEVPLYNLRWDTKKFRRADFKLTNLGIYVEYFGQYNATKVKRTEYDKKAEVYIKNSIPTVFIYPHELGFLEYAFHIKMVKLLKMEKFNLRRSLFRYRLNRFLENFLYTSGFGSFQSLFISTFLFSLILGVILIGEGTGLSDRMEIGLLCGSLGSIFINMAYIISDARRYFYKDE